MTPEREAELRDPCYIFPLQMHEALDAISALRSERDAAVDAVDAQVIAMRAERDAALVEVERLRDFLVEDDEALEPRRDLLKRVRGAARDRDLYRRLLILCKGERDAALAEVERLKTVNPWATRCCDACDTYCKRPSCD